MLYEENLDASLVISKDGIFNFIKGNYDKNIFPFNKLQEIIIKEEENNQYFPQDTSIININLSPKTKIFPSAREILKWGYNLPLIYY
jgi:hypothetical protein